MGIDKNKPKIKILMNGSFNFLKKLTKNENLKTVCEEAKCPNIFECWSVHKTATFMVLGDICTRRCRFCSVKTGKGRKVDAFEAVKVANSIKSMQLKHAVITMVNRDDLQDGGAAHIASCVNEIRRISDCKVEVLTSDFNGQLDSIKTVLNSKPHVFSHNLETVERLTTQVRSRFTYSSSLSFLKTIKELDPDMITKSSIMLGLGESYQEILQTMDDLLENGVLLMNIGQYLQPTKSNLPVIKYYSPQEFKELKEIALQKGFVQVFADPLVRSSYHADEQYFEYIKAITDAKVESKNSYEEERKKIHPLYKRDE